VPCVRCGESAKKHNGHCVGLSTDEEGNAKYWCLDCTIEVLKESINKEDG